MESSKNIQSDISDIIASLIDTAVEYCTMDPLTELLNRKKLEPKFNSNAPKIKLLSYNCLAESLQKENEKDTFPHETKFMEFNYRTPLIIKEISAYHPDVACLQEIDKDNDTIPSAFRSDYHLFFKSRRGIRADGCLTMIRKDSMEVIETHYMELYYDEKHPLLCKDNVVVITVVASKHSTNHLFFVANTHLLFNDNRGDIKTCQILMAVRALYELANSEKFKNFNKHFIYSGDFNLIPQSALYDMISRGSYNFSQLKRGYLTGQKLGKLSSFRDSAYWKTYYDFLMNNVNNHRTNPKNAETNMKELISWLQELYRIKLIINHPTDDQPSEIKFELENIDFSQVQADDRFFTVMMPLRLSSAYATFQRFYFGNSGVYPKYSTYEPIITSCPPESKLTVDYIWFSSFPQQKSMLRVRSIIEMPKFEQLIRYKKFPNRQYPSDHLSLIVELEIV